MRKTYLTRLAVPALAATLILALTACGQEPQTPPEEANSEVAETADPSTPPEPLPTEETTSLPIEREQKSAAEPVQPAQTKASNATLERGQADPHCKGGGNSCVPSDASASAPIDPHVGHDMSGM